MELSEFAGLLSVVTLFVNLGHWNGRRLECAVYFPRSGWLLVIFGACTGGATFLAIGYCFGVVSREIGLGVSLLWFGVIQMYSIWERHRQRKCTLSKQA